jgi:rhodanese-related sulfurtransferase
MGGILGEITCRELQQKMSSGEPLLLVDCREPEEHAVAAIAGSLLVPMSKWQEQHQILQPYRQQPVVVYCHLGVRSQRVVDWLREQGFTAAQSLAGGIDAWATEIDPGMARY